MLAIFFSKSKLLQIFVIQMGFGWTPNFERISLSLLLMLMPLLAQTSLPNRASWTCWKTAISCSLAKCILPLDTIFHKPYILASHLGSWTELSDRYLPFHYHSLSDCLFSFSFKHGVNWYYPSPYSPYTFS